METIPAGGKPQQAAQPVISESAPAAPSGSLQQTQDSPKSTPKPRTIAEVNTRIAEALKAKPVEAKTEVIPDVQAEVEVPAAEETPASTEAPPAADNQPAEGDPTPEQIEDGDPETDDDGGEGPITPISGKRTHLRIAQDDKVGRLAAAFMKRNRDMPMEQALERARAQLGIKPDGAKADEPVSPTPGLPDSIEATQAAIAAARADRKKANTELRFEEASDLSDKLEDLIQHRFNLERQEEKKQVAQASAYDQHFTASETRAAELYDFAGKPESEGAKRMLEIEADLKANDDPLYSSPDKPLKIAQMVAAELKIAPRRKGAPAAPAKAAAPVVAPQAAKKQMLPGGGSRTTPPPVNQLSPIDAKVQQARPKTVQGLRDLYKELGVQL